MWVSDKDDNSTDNLSVFKKRIWDLGWITKEDWTAGDSHMKGIVPKIGSDGRSVFAMLQSDEDGTEPFFQFVTIKSDLINDIAVMKHFFSINPKTGRPYLMIHRTRCALLWKQLKRMKYKGDTGKPQDGNDDAVDALRYAVLSHLALLIPSYSKYYKKQDNSKVVYQGMYLVGEAIKEHEQWEKDVRDRQALEIASKSNVSSGGSIWDNF
jgi:hypothetical protein